MSDNTLPQDAEYLNADITSSLQVRIASVNSKIPLEKPVYALNWFNTRYAWLYDFYNWLGTKSVLRVGGIPIFKGRVGDVLHGNQEDHRDVLLIVRYPKVESFKTMLESRYFQIVSLLRMFAVSDFTFAMSHRDDLDDNDDTDNDDSIDQIKEKGIPTSKIYAMHHYRSEAGNSLWSEVASLSKKHNVRLGLASQVSARVYSNPKNKPAEAVPTLMTHCIILQAETSSAIKELVAAEDYQNLIKQTDSSYIALLQRINLS